jgi:SAM-dependent methyltransferase
MAFDEAFAQLVLNQIRVNSETKAMLRKARDGREFLNINKDLKRGLALCDTEAKVLLYCYKYMSAHYDAYLHVLRMYSDLVNDYIFESNEKPLFIDFGCGPATSSLAIADYYNEASGKLLALSYIGIDICEPMLNKAREFSEYQRIFADDSKFKFLRSWDDIDINRLHNSLPGTTPLVLNFSYFFGQELNADELNSLTTFIERIRVKFRENRPLVIFLNASNLEANTRYRRFKTSLGLNDFIPNFNKVLTRWMRDFGQLEYVERERNNICYEMFSL